MSCCLAFDNSLKVYPILLTSMLSEDVFVKINVKVISPTGEIVSNEDHEVRLDEYRFDNNFVFERSITEEDLFGQQSSDATGSFTIECEVRTNKLLIELD